MSSDCWAITARSSRFATQQGGEPTAALRHDQVLRLDRRGLDRDRRVVIAAIDSSLVARTVADPSPAPDVLQQRHRHFAHRDPALPLRRGDRIEQCSIPSPGCSMPESEFTSSTEIVKARTPGRNLLEKLLQIGTFDGGVQQQSAALRSRCVPRWAPA